jgi:hypothetical protein
MLRLKLISLSFQMFYKTFTALQYLVLTQTRFLILESLNLSFITSDVLWVPLFIISFAFFSFLSHSYHPPLSIWEIALLGKKSQSLASMKV